MFPALSTVAEGKSFAAFEPKVWLPAGGAGVVGESKRPLNTARLTNGPGGTPAVVVPGPNAAHTFGSLPKGGRSRFVLIVEAVKTP
jgi:hypothetical protein